jgi:mevalonate kinase
LTVNLKIKPIINNFNKNNPQITICSDIKKFSGGLVIETSFDLKNLDFYNFNKNHKDYIYLLAVIDYFKQDLLKFNYNYEFVINSEINPNMGLGSSAAVVAAGIAVILKFLNKNSNQQEILAIGYKIINLVQGSGSGSDLVASIYGGVLFYNKQNFTVEKIADSLPLTVIYSGYKLSTAEVIKIIQNNLHQKNSSSEIYNKMFELIAYIVKEAKISIQEKDLNNLGMLFNISYGLQEALGVSDLVLSKIVYNLRNNKNILGAKISGSGLGDCVIGLGIDADLNSFNNFNILDVTIANIGLQ